MPLILQTIGEVPKRTIEAVASFCAVAQDIAGVRHRVPVRLIATDKFFYGGEKDGLFYYGEQTSEIWLAALALGGASQRLRDLAHEIRHYQQWASGDPIHGDEAEDEADAYEAELLRLVKRGNR